MKNNIKILVLQEISRRTENAKKFGSTQTAFTRIQNLLSFLSRPAKVNGEIKTVRAYYLKHDRKAYKLILDGLKLNRTTGAFSVFNKGLNIDLKYSFARIEDFKK